MLLGGVNDSLEDAARLARARARDPDQGEPHPVQREPWAAYRAPAPERVSAFQEALAARNLTAVVRKNRGRDISAACGQLAAEGGPGNPRRAAALTRLPVTG